MDGPRIVLAAATLALAMSRMRSRPDGLRLGTQAPTNSMWHKALLEMGATWAKITDGRVTLQRLRRRTAGDERPTIRKMRPARRITPGGAAHHRRPGGDRRRVQRARDAVLLRDRRRRARGAEEARAAARAGPAGERFPPGRVGHGRLGAAVFEEPLRSLAEVKAAKLYASKNDDRMVQWYTRNGFNPVPLLHRRHRAAAEAADGHDRCRAEHAVPRDDDPDLTAMRSTCSTSTSRRSSAR